MKKLIEVVPDEAKTFVVATIQDFIFCDAQPAIPGYQPIPPTLTLLCETTYAGIPQKTFLVKFFNPDMESIPILHKNNRYIVGFESGKGGAGVDPFFPHVKRKFFGVEIRHAYTSVN